jgi:hypothetical protein
MDQKHSSCMMEFVLWGHIYEAYLVYLDVGPSPQICKRRIHKISSVCKYYCCRAAVMMMRMYAEFVGPLGRHGCHLQTIEKRLRFILCVYNVQKNLEARRTWNAICNPFLECKKHETGWHSLSTL